MESFTQTVGKLGKWALGQRAFHDLVIHPLMALTGYPDFMVKLHDYHGFAALHAEPLIAICGRRDLVEEAFERLGITDDRVKHFHSDGQLCCGMGEPERRAPSPMRDCLVCNGSGQKGVRDWEGRLSLVKCTYCVNGKVRGNPV